LPEKYRPDYEIKIEAMEDFQKKILNLTRDTSTTDDEIKEKVEKKIKSLVTCRGNKKSRTIDEEKVKEWLDSLGKKYDENKEK